MPPLQAHCFGRFAVTQSQDAGAVPIHFATERVQALLAYLLAHPDEPQRREHLAYLIWPERPDELARQNLRKTLSRLRQAVAPHLLLISDYQTVQLNPEVIRSDVMRWQRLVQEANQSQSPNTAVLKEAAELYQGEFLHGFYLQDNHPFTEWLLLTREAWQRQAQEVLNNLVAHYQRLGEWQTALTYARQYVQIDPWQEEMQRTLLTCLAQTGQRAEALLHYQQYTAALQQELGLPPEAESVQLSYQLQQGQPMVEQASVWHGFPVEQTVFIGRTAELKQIHQHLQEQQGQLLTIMGMGGMGKTRLAGQAAQLLDPALFPDGIYFVACTAVESPADFLPHLISQLGLALDSSRPTAEQLQQYLARRKILLLLDNFEQLSQYAAELLAPLRQAHVNLLVTSRHALNLQGEHLIRLGGLDYGEALFMARAQRYDNRLFSAEEQQLIRELVQLVAGMPLAIEMAAAWLRAYDLPTLFKFLQQNLELWVAPQGDVPARHQSLDAVFDGSWQLLKPNLQLVLARLSLLQGTFTAEAAQKIALATFFDLAQLVDRSLLAVERNGRYHTHPLLRQLAQAKLTAVEPEAEQAAERHATYYLTLLHQQGQPLRGSQSQTAVRHIRQEYDNIRAAWVWCLARRTQQPHLQPLIQQALTPLANYFLVVGLFAEGATLLAEIAPLLSAELWLERGEYKLALPLIQTVLQDAAVPPEMRLRAYALLCAAHQQESKLELIRQTMAEGLSLAAEFPQSVAAAYLYIQATLAAVGEGNHTAAQQFATQALPIFYQADDLWGASKALYAQAVVDGVTNQDARPRFYQILHLQKQIGSPAVQQNALHNLALGHMLHGEYATAIGLCHEAWEICQQLSHDLLIADNRLLWGRIQQRIGNWSAASKGYDEALHIWDMHHLTQFLAYGTIYKALLAQYEGEAQQALALCTQAEAWSQQIQRPLYKGMLAVCRARAMVSLGDWGMAQQYGEEAAAIFGRLQFPGRLADVQSMLAYIYWQQGAAERALAQVEDILAYRAGVALLKSDDPVYLEWCCYQVLQGVGDARAAVIWAETHQKLRQQMAQLESNFLPQRMAQVPHYQPFLAAG
ncbi:MAG: BTAD domain-containing putative transcriptional regulator [Chloroflexi bacterium]|nr:BTAD domain-containing putative transcriptional regulator [Chloroflexota bacterium]